jgi:hypothetical protein
MFTGRSPGCERSKGPIEALTCQIMICVLLKITWLKRIGIYSHAEWQTPENDNPG